MDGILRDYDRPDVPGASVGIFRGGEILIAKGYGLADLETGRRSTARTCYRFASIAKQFTALAVVILKERGRLAYDDPVAAHLDGLPAWGRAVTIRHLLGHTSGILDYEPHLPAGRTDPLLDADVLEILRGLPATHFPPGAQFRYSNGGYALLALVAERRSGRRFADLLREAVFDPLGMRSTLAHEEGRSVVPERAYGHVLRDGAWVRADQSLTSAVLGDGGIYGSVGEYALWDAALSGPGLVSASALAEVFSRGRLADGSPTGYGLGWFIEEGPEGPRHRHGGSTIGFNHAVVRIVSCGTTVIVLTSRGVEGSARALCDRVVDLALHPGNAR